MTGVFFIISLIRSLTVCKGIWHKRLSNVLELVVRVCCALSVVGSFFVVLFVFVTCLFLFLVFCFWLLCCIVLCLSSYVVCWGVFFVGCRSPKYTYINRYIYLYIYIYVCTHICVCTYVYI